MNARQLRRLSGRRLVAVPSCGAAPDVWLLVRLYPELSPSQELAEADALLVPVAALLDPDAHQPDATRLHELLTNTMPDRPAGQPRVRFIGDATEALDAVRSNWDTAGIEWFRVAFELVGLVEGGAVDAVGVYDLAEDAEALFGDVPLRPGLGPSGSSEVERERLRRLLEADLAVYLAGHVAGP